MFLLRGDQIRDAATLPYTHAPHTFPFPVTSLTSSAWIALEGLEQSHTGSHTGLPLFLFLRNSLLPIRCAAMSTVASSETMPIFWVNEFGDPSFMKLECHAALVFDLVENAARVLGLKQRLSCVTAHVAAVKEDGTYTIHDKALPVSMTLAEAGLEDGALLVLKATAPRESGLPVPTFPQPRSFRFTPPSYGASFKPSSSFTQIYRAAAVVDPSNILVSVLYQATAGRRSLVTALSVHPDTLVATVRKEIAIDLFGSITRAATLSICVETGIAASPLSSALQPHRTLTTAMRHLTLPTGEPVHVSVDVPVKLVAQDTETCT